MNALDPIAQRILGVLVEKEVTVPETYPLTENALLAGANQKNNRDPEMALGSVDVRAALETLREGGWASRVEAPGARVRKWRHHFESQLGIQKRECAILVELLLRGPQAPGALKPRIARFGVEAEAEGIRSTLEGLARRSPPLVECLPRWPRERDERWRHCLGPMAQRAPDEASRAEPAVWRSRPSDERETAAPMPKDAEIIGAASSLDMTEILERLTHLEAALREAEARLDVLERRSES